MMPTPAPLTTTTPFHHHHLFPPPPHHHHNMSKHDCNAKQHHDDVTTQCPPHTAPKCHVTNQHLKQQHSDTTTTITHDTSKCNRHAKRHHHNANAQQMTTTGQTQGEHDRNGHGMARRVQTVGHTRYARFSFISLITIQPTASLPHPFLAKTQKHEKHAVLACFSCPGPVSTTTIPIHCHHPFPPPPHHHHSTSRHDHHAKHQQHDAMQQWQRTTQTT